MHRLFAFALVLTAGTFTACTGLDRNSTNVLAPSSTSPSSTASPSPSPSPTAPEPTHPSLLGMWSSNLLSGISVSSCAGLSWQVTSQTANSVAGTFSATCADGMSATGAVSGHIDGTNVPYTVTGTASLPGLPACPFSLTGTAVIVDSDTLRVPYSGTTCIAPVSGEETLRRPSQTSPEPTPAPEPEPAPAPVPVESPYHVGPGPLSMSRAEQVINATADEFRGLTAARPTEGEAASAATELLRRMIWHLRHAGFEAGRQKNPSGAISGDKLTVFADGAWHAVDVFFDYGTPGVPVKVIFWEVFPANPVGDEGISD